MKKLIWLLLLMATQGNAWWDSNWTNRRQVKIITPTLKNWQVNFVTQLFDTSVRFTRNDVDTLFFVALTKDSSYMVKVDSLSPVDDTARIYAYYSNTGVAEGSNNSAYTFYDDFDDGDITDWYQKSGIWTTAAVSGHGQVLRDSTIGTGTVCTYDGAEIYRPNIVADSYCASVELAIDGSYTGLLTRADSSQSCWFMAAPYAYISLNTWYVICSNGSWEGCGSGTKPVTVSAWDITYLKVIGDTHKIFVKDSIITLITNVHNTDNDIGAISLMTAGPRNILDDIKIRRWKGSEFTVIIGAEESYTPPSGAKKVITHRTGIW